MCGSAERRQRKGNITFIRNRNFLKQKLKEKAVKSYSYVTAMEIMFLYCKDKIKTKKNYDFAVTEIEVSKMMSMIVPATGNMY